MDNQPQTPKNLPTKETGKECILERKKDLDKITNISNEVVKQLNTRPLVVVAVGTKDGDKLMLAFDEGPDRYCPIAVLEPTARIKKVVEAIYLTSKYTLVPQKDIPGFKEYDEDLQ